MVDDVTDVLIVGAGVAGLGLACALARFVRLAHLEATAEESVLVHLERARRSSAA